MTGVNNENERVIPPKDDGFGSIGVENPGGDLGGPGDAGALDPDVQSNTPRTESENDRAEHEPGGVQNTAPTAAGSGERVRNLASSNDGVTGPATSAPMNPSLPSPHPLAERPLKGFRFLGTVPVCDVDVPTPADQNELVRYQQGDCHAFAFGMKQLYPNLRFGVLYMGDDPQHVFCHDDQRRIFDVLGTQQEHHLRRFDDFRRREVYGADLPLLMIAYDVPEEAIRQHMVPEEGYRFASLGPVDDRSFEHAVKTVQRLYPENPGLVLDGDDSLDGLNPEGKPENPDVDYVIVGQTPTTAPGKTLPDVPYEPVRRPGQMAKLDSVSELGPQLHKPFRGGPSTPTF